ncbi:MAG: hypothetical protein M3P40_00275 [Actinomycetota bacterium]|nr:hypothetical protein [Actinomycetota bacterium]
MADPRRFELDELHNRPGTYVNPDTEVVIVVDDSATIDAELFADSDADGDWLLVSDDVAVDETRRDEMLERLQLRAGRGNSAPLHDADDDEDVVEEDDFRSAGFNDADED